MNARMGQRVAAAIGCACAAAAVLLPAAPSLAAGKPAFGQGVEISLPANSSRTPTAQLLAVSCTGSGACVAGGTYQTPSGFNQAMVATEAHGRWARAVELSMPKGSLGAQVNALACPAAGACVAVGQYTSSAAGDPMIGFAASESGGKWGRATALAAPRGAASPQQATITGLSCPARGDCAAVGTYAGKNASSVLVAFGASKGRWGPAQVISPPAGAMTGSPSLTLMESVSCSKAGDCAATGGYFAASGAAEPLGVVESGGHWQRAVPVKLPANATAEANMPQGVAGLSCTGGSCVGVGNYIGKPGQKVMSGTESGGRFGPLQEVTAEPKGVSAHAITDLGAVSCPSGGFCAGAGSYIVGASAVQGMVMFRSGGTWGDAAGLSLPRNSASGSGRSSILAGVSCASTRYCVAVGYYVDKAQDLVPLAVAT
jgi:hypothetical protein